MGPRWQTSQLQLDLDPQCMLIVTHQQAKWHAHRFMTVPSQTFKDHQKLGGGPIPGNLCPFPPNSWNNPPTHQPIKEVCLSLNSVCNETSRTWASLSPETRCVISVGRLDFGQVWVLACGFKAQSRLHHFTFFSTGVNLAMDLIWPMEHGQEWQGAS